MSSLSPKISIKLFDFLVNYPRFLGALLLLNTRTVGFPRGPPVEPYRGLSWNVSVFHVYVLVLLLELVVLVLVSSK